MKKIFTAFTALLICISINAPAHAGVYTDDLTRCIVETTTEKDRIKFVKWMFSAMSKHPAVNSIASVSDDQINTANKQVAQLFMRIMTETCKEKAKKAIKYDGQLAMQTSFQVLGQVAAQELFSNPEVAGVMSGLEMYIDTDELASSLGLK